MKLRYEKNIRIITDVLGYCYALGARELHTDLSIGDLESTITVTARLDNILPETLQRLNTFLNIPRQREVEQNYWNISGQEEIDGELSLAGMMVDEARVVYENGLLTVEMRRSETSNEE